jgi:hypothetical protein
MSGAWGVRAGAFLVLMAALTAPARATAQAEPQAHEPARAETPGWLFPDRALIPSLLAGQREPVIQARLVYSTEDPTLYGRGFSGDVALAGTLPVLLLSGATDDDALVVGLEGVVFARFAFQVLERELVNSDWFFSVPVVWHRGRHWLRLRYVHTSSHLGDEYAARFGAEAVNFSRDGADLTVYMRPRPGLGVYGMGFISVNAHPVRSHGSHVRVGLELGPSGGETWRPFAAAELRLEGAGEILPLASMQAGVWLPSPASRPLRLAVDVATGRSPMGQFHGQRMTQIAVGLFWSP